MSERPEPKPKLWPKWLQIVAVAILWAYVIGIISIVLTMHRPDAPMLVRATEHATPGDEAKEAIRHLEQAIREKPDDPEILNTMGWALHKDGRDHEGILCLQRAMIVAPHDFRAYNNLGLILFHEGDFAGAITNYEQALRLDPSAEGVRSNLLRARAQMAEALRTSGRRSEPTTAGE